MRSLLEENGALWHIPSWRGAVELLYAAVGSKVLLAKVAVDHGAVKPMNTLTAPPSLTHSEKSIAEQRQKQFGFDYFDRGEEKKGKKNILLGLHACHHQSHLGR